MSKYLVFVDENLDKIPMMCRKKILFQKTSLINFMVKCGIFAGFFKIVAEQSQGKVPYKYRALLKSLFLVGIRLHLHRYLFRDIAWYAMKILDLSSFIPSWHSFMKSTTHSLTHFESLLLPFCSKPSSTSILVLQRES